MAWKMANGGITHFKMISCESADNAVFNFVAASLAAYSTPPPPFRTYRRGLLVADVMFYTPCVSRIDLCARATHFRILSRLNTS